MDINAAVDGPSKYCSIRQIFSSRNMMTWQRVDTKRYREQFRIRFPSSCLLCVKGQRVNSLKTVFSAVLSLALLVSLNSCGKEATPSEEWPVEGKIVGAGRDEDKPKKSRDVSGIACDRQPGFPRRCLVIDDEAQAAQAVTVHDGRVVANAVVPLISDSFAGHPLELDGEGVAFADGAYYVIGSHGHPRDRKHRLDPRADADEIAAKIKASAQVLRVRLPPSAWDGDVDRANGDVTSSTRLREAIASNAELAPFLDQRLDNGGMTVEGIAVTNGRLYVGFRSPVLDAKSAVIMDVNLGSVFERGSLDTKVTKLDLGGRGVRDLAVYGSSFLILAGPEAGDHVGDGAPAAEEGDAHAVYTWDGSNSAKLIGELPSFAAEGKPEAILPLGDSGHSTRLLIFSDGLKEGGPRAITLDR